MPQIRGAMGSLIISVSIPEPVHKKLRRRAEKKKISVSGYVRRLIESNVGDAMDDPLRFPMEELERRCREADDPANCTVYHSVEELLEHMDEIAAKID